MNTATLDANPALASLALERLGLSRDRAAHAPLLAIAGSLLIAACAHIAVPMWPVPATMQTFAVLLVGATLGARVGAAAVMLYLLEGALGLPVFAPGGAPGFARFFGPTGGYLLGFLLAATLVGALAQRGMTRTFVRAASTMLVGTIVILTLGGAWMAAFFPQEDAFEAGFLVFLPGGVLKALLAAALLPVAWKLVAKR